MRISSIIPVLFAASLGLGGCVDSYSGARLGPPDLARNTTVFAEGRGHPRVIRRGDDVYFNGRRGHREHRDGYRRYEGFWFPVDAFIGMIIVNGVARHQVVLHGDDHIRWCSDRYRSYRIDGNSFQPRSGGRRACRSPFG